MSHPAGETPEGDPDVDKSIVAGRNTNVHDKDADYPAATVELLAYAEAENPIDLLAAESQAPRDHRYN